jgi:hypothetical protein
MKKIIKTTKNFIRDAFVWLTNKRVVEIKRFKGVRDANKFLSIYKSPIRPDR